MSEELVPGLNGIPSNFKSEVNEVPHAWEKICFDSLSYKKEQKYKHARKIPSGEEILAYTKPLPLFSPAAIFTDLALYTDIAGRIPYVTLPRYTIEKDGSKDAVFLADVDTDIKIISSSLVMNNTIGEEVRGFLSSLQSYICERYEWAKQESREACRKVIAKSREELRHGPLSKRLNNAIYGFQLRTASSDDAYLFRAEEVFRWCDMEYYQEFINTLPDYYVTPEMQITIRASQPIFEANLLNDIKDLDNNYDEHQAILIRERLSDNASLSDTQTLIYGYAAARLNNTTEYVQALNAVKAKLGNGKAIQLDAFRGMYFNHRMSFLYDKIDKGEELNSSEVNWTDSLGLKPVHYAIMLGKDYRYVNKLLEKELPEDPENLTPKDDSYALVMHPLVFCVFAGADMMIWLGIIRQTSKSYNELEKCKVALERRLKWIRRKQSVQEMVLSNKRKLYRQAKEQHNDEAIQEMRDLIAEQQDLINETKEEITELISEIDEAATEMADYAKSL